MDKLRKFLTDLTSAVQAGKIYSARHPRFKEFLASSFESLRAILEDQEEVAVGVVEGEVACGKEVFFDLSQKLKPLLIYLEERGIERFSISRGVVEEEWRKFVSFLALPRGQAMGNPHEYLVLQGVRSIRAGRIEAPAPLDIRAQVTLEKQYESALASLARSVEKILNREKLDAIESRFLVFNLMEAFHSRHQELFGFSLAAKKERLLFPHFLNTALLAMSFAARLGFSRDDVLDIGVASLYHDVGRLDRGEGQPLGDYHSLFGACLLLEQKEAVGVLPAVVAFEHHLRYDLKGSSSLSYRKTLHPVTRLVSICDIYDELYQKRMTRRQFTPPRIHEIMVRGKGSRFDPEYLDKFYRNMGVWPVGMAVLLSDGRKAVVRKVNEENIFSPQVEVIDPPERKEWIDLAVMKDKITIQASLFPNVSGG